jgi:hypothetical protein
MVDVAIPIRSPMALQTPNTCHSIKYRTLFMIVNLPTIFSINKRFKYCRSFSKFANRQFMLAN